MFPWGHEDEQASLTTITFKTNVIWSNQYDNS